MGEAAEEIWEIQGRLENQVADLGHELSLRDSLLSRAHEELGAEHDMQARLEHEVQALRDRLEVSACTRDCQLHDAEVQTQPLQEQAQPLQEYASEQPADARIVNRCVSATSFEAVGGLPPGLWDQLPQDLEGVGRTPSTAWAK